MLWTIIDKPNGHTKISVIGKILGFFLFIKLESEGLFSAVAKFKRNSTTWDGKFVRIYPIVSSSKKLSQNIKEQK